MIYGFLFALSMDLTGGQFLHTAPLSRNWETQNAWVWLYKWFALIWREKKSTGKEKKRRISIYGSNTNMVPVHETWQWWDQRLRLSYIINASGRIQPRTNTHISCLSSESIMRMRIKGLLSQKLRPGRQTHTHTHTQCVQTHTVALR